MLRCNMNASAPSLTLGLDDLLGDLRHARREGDLGRLALLAYCEVRRWARMAGEESLAEYSTDLVTHLPHSNRDAFLVQVDELILQLERLRGHALSQAAHRSAAMPTALRAGDVGA